MYVKLDTLGYNKFYATLVTKKILIDFVFNVLADRYSPTYLAQNLGSFTMSDTDFKDLISYIQSKNIKVEPKQLTASKSIIYNDVKVMLCKYHLGDIGYYKASNLTDPVVKTALANLQ